jgi:hypothetical protein
MALVKSAILLAMCTDRAGWPAEAVTITGFAPVVNDKSTHISRRGAMSMVGAESTAAVPSRPP